MIIVQSVAIKITAEMKNVDIIKSSNVLAWYSGKQPDAVPLTQMPRNNVFFALNAARFDDG